MVDLWKREGVMIVYHVQYQIVNRKPNNLFMVPYLEMKEQVAKFNHNLNDG